MFDSTFWFKAFELLASLSILVFVHELGHFMWARFFKVGVEKFYLFFDAYDFALVRWNKQGLHFFDWIHLPRLVNPSATEYGIGWVPLGGYCAIVGMVDETHNSEQADMDRPDAFVKQGKFAQFMIMVGGVLNNVILAVIIYIGMAWHWGEDTVYMRNVTNGMVFSEYARQVGFQNGDIIWSVDGREADFYNVRNCWLLGNEATVRRGEELVTIQLPDTMGKYFLANKIELERFSQIRHPMVVMRLLSNGPVAQAGLQVGDSIVMIDSVATPYFDYVLSSIANRAGDTILVTFFRSGIEMSLPVVLDEDSKMGFVYNYIPTEYVTHVDYSLAEAIPAGIVRGCDILYNYVRQFKLVFTKEGAKELGGFGSMGAIFPEEWIWKAFWGLTAFISVALAFMNILPIPALDGGHIMILIIEAIIRRPLSNKLKDRLQYIGFGFIVLLMVAVNANDIIKFFF